MSTKVGSQQKWTLKRLAEYGQKNKMDEVMAFFFSQEDIAVKVADIINELIREYNSLFADSKKKSVLLKYKKYLYRLLEVCIPFIDTRSKTYVYVDRCILADDTDDKEFYDFHFIDSVNEANAYIKSIKVTYDKVRDSEISFTMGLMNFKVHKYKVAVSHLMECKKSMQENGLNNDLKKITFSKCIIYLASSYEYNDMLSEALEQLLGMDKDSFHENLIAQNEALIGRIMKLYKKLCQDSVKMTEIMDICILLGKKDYDIFRVLDLSHYEYQDVAISYFHVLAHCMSEFSSKLILENEEEYPYCALLQLISRFLIDWLVSIDDAYVTCQATVRAENDACPEAIDLLLSQYESKYGSDVSEKEMTKKKAELEFYIFYFAEQELRFNYEDKPLLDIFHKFGKDFQEYSLNAVSGKPDYDSLFHYWVIQCKYLLKKYAKEALKSGLTVDYSELDKAILQMIKCKKEISKHVFESLVKECNRLEKLYALFLQFRYVNKGRNGTANVKEFQTLMEQENYDLNEGYEKNIEKLYIEIEKRNKILILAPVYESPSCSFSVQNVDKLIEIQPEIINDTTEELDKVKHTFRKIGVEHSKPFISRKKFMSQRNEPDNIVKWALYDNERNAFLYYKDFRKINGEYSKELFPLILTDFERKKLNCLLKELYKKCEENFVECGDEHTGKNHGGTYTCNTKFMRYHTEDKTGASEALLNLLVFLELDFMSANKACRLEEKDIIILRYIPSRENGNQYSIFALPSNFPENTERVCEWGEFEDTLDIESKNKVSVFQEREHIKACSTCRKINFDITLKKVSAMKNESSSGSQINKEFIGLEDMIKECMAGKCVDTENQNGGTCVLINKLMERGIEPKWESDE